jgi:trehalose 2-sulfotransferase
VPPNLSYAVCATQRSGSNFLCNLLSVTCNCGNAHEFFRDWHMASVNRQQGSISPLPDSREVIQARLAQILKIGATSNGVFGMKIMGNQTAVLKEKLNMLPRLGSSSLWEALNLLFPNLKYIHLRRKDRIAQAVSFARARQSNIWTVHKRLVQEEKPGHPDDVTVGATDITYNYKLIAECLADIERQEAFWTLFFRKSGIEPLRLVYEELEHDPDTEVTRVLEHLALSGSIPGSSIKERGTLKRQRDELNTEWVRRFRQDRESSCPA